MNLKLRKATLGDVPQFIEIKNQLSFQNIDGTSTNGGFLLGTDENTYARFVENDFVLVAEKDQKLVGFGIILTDDSLKKSEIWRKRNAATWYIDIEQYADKKMCYFEQLAFKNGYSRAVLKLGYNLACKAFQTHEHLITTTVSKPILNLAAVPYIIKSGGKKVGKIDETYPIIGQIVSDIYKIDKAVFEKRAALSPFKKLLESYHFDW